MIHFFYKQAEFTHGEDGIQSVPRGMLFGMVDLSNTTAMYIFVAGVFLLGFAIIYRVIHSPFGAVLTAIRENEPRAISLGYNTDHYKWIAFILSAALAGLAGATKALVFQFAVLQDADWPTSGEVVLMTLIGGLGRFTGPVVGAFVIVALEKWLADLGGWVTVAQGVAFVICVLTFRQGIIGAISNWLKLPL
jgi:branched-chain amino acid transport system permease protein